MMSFIISVGKYGGFYCCGGRVCLGWIAFTLIPCDIDEIFPSRDSYPDKRKRG